MRNFLVAACSAAVILAVTFGVIELGALAVRHAVENFEWRIVLAVFVSMPLAVALGVLCGAAVWKGWKV